MASSAALAGCASQAPRVTGEPAYALASIDASGEGRGTELAAALDTASSRVSGGGTPVTATVEVDLVRYNSPIIGLFYGGPDHAALSVTLTDVNGRRIDRFDLFVGVDAQGTQADADLSAKAADIIAARAANAYPPMRSVPKAVAKPAVELGDAAIADVPDQPVVVPSDPEPQSTEPLCIIDENGNCIPL
ncbi:MAG: hypothetical protein MUC58_05740 [Rhizobiaceae bacterium]|nr:hypothetical protein [Rhizobiaceae bacterium]